LFRIIRRHASGVLVLPNYLSALPQFLSYFLVALLMVSVFWSIYTFLTPHDELALIREGNTSAALAITGALLGFALPVAAAITHSVSLMALVQWSLVAMAVQLAVYTLLRLLMPGLNASIVQDRPAGAILLAGLSLLCGLLNAAAMHY
jgi:putative membrane protein